MTTRNERQTNRANDYLDKAAAKIAEFSRMHAPRKDWHEPDNQNIEAAVVGNHLDNATGDFIHDTPQDFQEYVVVLTGPRATTKINLATLLAVAARAGGY